MATGAQPLQLDITANSGLFSLSVDLQPLRTAEEVAALQLALRRYPAGTRSATRRSLVISAESTRSSR